MFIGRKRELSILEEQYKLPSGSLFVLYGRRRVGKTELLQQFCKNKSAVFFTASQIEPRDNLLQFIEICAQELNDGYLLQVGFVTLEAVLTYIAEKHTSRKLIIVLDEFQYWAQGDKSLPSLLQRFWDRTGKNSKIMIVLCGSYVSLMVDQTLAEKSPLYGRRTGQLQLRPFDFRTACRFFPKWPAVDKLTAYAILGGMPAYHAQFDPAETLEQNILHRLLQKGTFLSEESAFLLRSELRDVQMYASMLKGIAGGNTTVKDISSKTAIDGKTLSFYLSNLQALNLVSRQVSMFEPAPEKSRKGRYSIADNFLNFWFRFVEPHISMIELNQGKQLYQFKIQPGLSTYMGPRFETICRQYVQLYGSEIGLPPALRVGSAWEKDYDLDVVAENIDGTFTLGECKWTLKPPHLHVANLLRERSLCLPLSGRKKHLLIFSRQGPNTKMIADVRSVSIRQLLNRDSSRKSSTEI